jgi:RNA polymerase sigma-70 factor (ECF subfamily)
MNETVTSDQLDANAIQQLTAGDDTALDDLIERHGPKLFNYLVRSLQNEEDAEDLAQETFVRVYQNCSKFDKRQRFSTWMFAIATNLVRDRFRYRQRHPQVSIDDPEHSQLADSERQTDSSAVPLETMIAAERADQVRHAIQSLPEELRTPLILFEYQDQSHADIASILNCSPKAVEMRLYRARQQLRDKLSFLLETHTSHGQELDD